MQSWAQALLSGFISFLFVVVVTFITLEASPMWAGIVWSLPFSITAVITVFYASKEPDFKSFQLLISGGFSMIALVVQMLVWGFIIKSKFLFSRSTRYWGGFGISMAVWLLINAMYISIVYAVPKSARMIV